MLSVNQLTFKVKNKTLIDELTLNVTPGSFYALLGRKGSGKTTLLRLCSGLLEPQSGNIYINGMDVSKRENKKNILRFLPSLIMTPAVLEIKLSSYPLAIELNVFILHGSIIMPSVINEPLDILAPKSLLS